MIFVTGGAGFIGSNFILDWLAEVGEPVVTAIEQRQARARYMRRATGLAGWCSASHPEEVEGLVCLARIIETSIGSDT